MSDPSRAIFLSYASQDTEVAQRICEALRAAGIEVWFDQSELRGGDAWDQKIRRQIRDCALFIPIISRNTQLRTEGYFRLEWRLADQRTYLMAKSRTFLVPVCIDATGDSDAEVPESFAAVQWTRLPAGTTPSALVQRLLTLLSPLDPLLAAAPVPDAPASVQHAPAEKSIAVLPFTNMSADKEQEYFSDGLAEEMINLLAKIPDLRVPARSSSFYFKGKAERLATIAKELGVAHILEGSVRKSGNRLRVTTQLVRADSGYHLWSETFDRELHDVFAVQDEIAGAVVAALKLKLAPGLRAARSHRTQNAEAYNLYLLGRQFINRDNVEGYRRAVDCFRKAISLSLT